MALVKSVLENGLRELMDPEYVNFSGFPETTIEVASRWSEIVDNYAKSVLPTSLSSAAAKSAFNSIMLGISPTVPNGIALLISAFTAYAASLAGGMAPTFTGVPPITPVNLTPVISAGLGGASGDVTAALMANIIHTWFKTGTAINVSSGATITWN